MKLMNKLMLILGAIACVGTLLADDSIKEVGRDLVEKRSDSVLYVSFTIEINLDLGGQGGHQGMEQTLEALGTVSPRMDSWLCPIRLWT